ncbi:MAG: hypothetical protein AAGC74_14725 [Verrucomicrobiota bacterium]
MARRTICRSRRNPHPSLPRRVLPPRPPRLQPKSSRPRHPSRRPCTTQNSLEIKNLLTKSARNPPLPCRPRRPSHRHPHGPRSLKTHRPLGRFHERLSSHAECSPCLLPKCPLDHRCLLDLSVDEVTDSLVRLFNSLAAA